MNLSPMPEVVIGNGAFNTLEQRLDGYRRVMIVSGPHVSHNAVFDKLVRLARGGGRAVSIFADTPQDPSIDLAREVSGLARAFRADTVLAIGGGSPLDTAKIVAAALTNPEDIETFIGTDQIKRRAAPMLAVPATAGTGSEVTNISILTDTLEQMKKAVVSDHIIPSCALLIPELACTMPPAVTAAGGMDAFCHAAEAYTSTRRNPFSDALALKALRIIADNLPTAQREPENIRAREQMQIAALLAGLAFTNSSVTAIHAFAYPLGGLFHIPHGMANSLMIESVMRHNMQAVPERFSTMAEVLTGHAGAERFIPFVRRLKANLSMPLTLEDAGVSLDALPGMAESVMTVSRLLSVNPAPIAPEDAVRIYREAYQGA